MLNTSKHKERLLIHFAHNHLYESPKYSSPSAPTVPWSPLISLTSLLYLFPFSQSSWESLIHWCISIRKVKFFSDCFIFYTYLNDTQIYTHIPNAAHNSHSNHMSHTQRKLNIRITLINFKFPSASFKKKLPLSSPYFLIHNSFPDSC